MGDQVAEPLMKALEKGDSRVEISLTPETLGNVRVEITRSQDGSLHVALSADTAQTRSLLEKHRGQSSEFAGGPEPGHGSGGGSAAAGEPAESEA